MVEETTVRKADDDSSAIAVTRLPDHLGQQLRRKADISGRVVLESIGRPASGVDPALVESSH